MSDALLIDEPAPHVLLLTLNRPAQRNAIDLALTEALEAAFARLRDEDHWRVAILAGTPPAFCAGLDLKAFAAPDAPRERVTALIRGIPRLGKPIIAAVGGAAYTGGLELALTCDFILAGEAARFADTHAKIGALSGSGMSARLPDAVGMRLARQMMLACQPVDAATALRAGLVNEVVPDDGLIARAIGVAQAIAAHDPGLIRIARDILCTCSETTLSEALRIESEALARRKAEGAMTWNSAR